MLTALSPLDGRYEAKVGSLRTYFSEFALMRMRFFIEISYFIALSKEAGLKELPAFPKQKDRRLWKLLEEFDEKEAKKVKKIEETTRHDVKAVEYYLCEKLLAKRICKKAETAFVHFGLTSADVNNLAYGLLIQQALAEEIIPCLDVFIGELSKRASRWRSAAMLSLTHGQPATPTTVGKEICVFVDRLQRQMQSLKRFRMQGKFGGAVGTYAAHRAAYPRFNWKRFGEAFVRTMGLTPLRNTTQINPHDDLAELSHVLCRIDTILIDFSRDMWLYISRGVFRQKLVSGEVGSSTMPHKINPIDFENAEGNLGLACALFNHFAEKLPISRMQRDLSDSTVLRNVGVAFGHHFLAVESLHRGLKRLDLERRVLERELKQHPEVVGEAIQTLLRKHGVSDAYEQLKTLTRGGNIECKDLEQFLENCPFSAEERKRILDFLP